MIAVIFSIALFLVVFAVYTLLSLSMTGLMDKYPLLGKIITIIFSVIWFTDNPDPAHMGFISIVLLILILLAILLFVFVIVIVIFNKIKEFILKLFKKEKI